MENADKSTQSQAIEALLAIIEAQRKEIAALTARVAAGSG